MLIFHDLFDAVFCIHTSKIGQKMPFFIDFTKVNHFFEMCKKSKENFILLISGL